MILLELLHANKIQLVFKNHVYSNGTQDKKLITFLTFAQFSGKGRHMLIKIHYEKRFVLRELDLAFCSHKHSTIC